MTAAEAREAAAWFSNAATYDHNEGSKPGREWYAMRGKLYDRAAVALDAFADGIDAAVVEREACAAMVEAAAQRNAASAVGFPEASSEPWWTTRANALKSAAQAIRERGVK